MLHGWQSKLAVPVDTNRKASKEADVHGHIWKEGVMRAWVWGLVQLSVCSAHAPTELESPPHSRPQEHPWENVHP